MFRFDNNVKPNCRYFLYADLSMDNGQVLNNKWRVIKKIDPVPRELNLEVTGKLMFNEEITTKLNSVETRILIWEVNVKATS